MAVAAAKRPGRAKAKTPITPRTPVPPSEVDAELAKLRGKVTKLCRKFQHVDESEREEKHERRSRIKHSRELRSLLDQARRAKLEALEYTSYGRAELVDQVKRLTGILHEAKLECEEKDERIAALERRASVLQIQSETLNKRLELERTYFGKLLERERRQYGIKLQRALRGEDPSTDLAEDLDPDLEAQIDALSETKDKLHAAYAERYELLGQIAKPRTPPDESKLSDEAMLDETKLSEQALDEGGETKRDDAFEREALQGTLQSAESKFGEQQSEECDDGKCGEAAASRALGADEAAPTDSQPEEKVAHVDEIAQVEQEERDGNESEAERHHEGKEGGDEYESKSARNEEGAIQEDDPDYLQAEAETKEEDQGEADGVVPEEAEAEVGDPVADANADGQQEECADIHNEGDEGDEDDEDEPSAANASEDDASMRNAAAPGDDDDNAGDEEDNDENGEEEEEGCENGEVEMSDVCAEEAVEADCRVDQLDNDDAASDDHDAVEGCAGQSASIDDKGAAFADDPPAQDEAQSPNCSGKEEGESLEVDVELAGKVERGGPKTPFGASIAADSNPAKSEVVLPKGWTKEWSRSKERHYYFCYESGLSVWRLQDIPEKYKVDSPDVRSQ